jgi:hypothetical protein
VSTSSGASKKRMEFVNRDFKAAINVSRYAALKSRPEELARLNFMGSSSDSKCAGRKCSRKQAANQKRLGRVCRCVYTYPLYS